MEDLINEDEFLPEHYNPNSWFGRFYIGAFIFEVLMIVSFRFIVPYNTSLSIFMGIITSFIIPVGLAVVMVFSKKEILLDLRNIAIVKGILILHACFFIPRIITVTYDYLLIYLEEGISDIFLMLLTPLASFAILYGIALAIIIPLVNRSRNKQRNLTKDKAPAHGRPY